MAARDWSRNSTGITNMAAVLIGKRLEFLKETIPKVFLHRYPATDRFAAVGTLGDLKGT